MGWEPGVNEVPKKLKWTMLAPDTGDRQVLLGILSRMIMALNCSYN